MATHLWAIDGPVMGYTAVAGQPVPSAVEALPGRALQRLLDRGYIEVSQSGDGSAVLTKAAADATYRARLSDPQSITYNTDGTVHTVTETDTGAVITYTYNADGTPATEARALGGTTTTRTFTYASGNLTAVA